MPWNATDQTRPQREATRKATASLLGHAPTTWAQLAEQGAALTPDAVQEAMRGALDTAILVIPEGVRVPERFASRPYQPAHRPRFGTLYVRWDANPHDQISLNDRGVTRQVGRSIWSADFADVEALLLGPDGSVWLVRRDGAGLLIEPNQLMRGRELAATLQDRLLDRVVDLRGDVVAWFEMQNLLESHDPSVIQSIWQEIEILAQQRRAARACAGHRRCRPRRTPGRVRGHRPAVHPRRGQPTGAVRVGAPQRHRHGRDLDRDQRGTTPDPRPGTRNRVGGPDPPTRPRRGAGRAAHADHRPLPVTPGHVVIGGPINRSASILGLWR